MDGIIRSMAEFTNSRDGIIVASNAANHGVTKESDRTSAEQQPKGFL